MFGIQQITTDSRQQQTLILSDGTLLGISLYYSPQQVGWFISDLTYGSAFTLQGVRVVVSPNMLRQFQNLVPFGLACFSLTAKREPTQQEDFASGAFQLAILTEDEVRTYENFLERSA